MNIELLPFQKKAVRSLIDATENRTENIVLKSCTGSGKTIILTHFMAEYLKFHDDTVFMWFTPGKGNLEEQSKRKMDLYIHGSKTKLLPDVMTSGFCGGDCCFINWDLLNKNTNNARKEGEHTNFDEYVQKALESGLNFVLIIDESHTNDTLKTKEIVELFHAKSIIRASATPKGYDKLTSLIEIPENEVIEQGLIKKLLVINEDFAKLDGEIIQEEQVSFLLEKALKKQHLLRSSFLERGASVNPLILVQMPNSSDTLFKSVVEWFEKKKINVANRTLAIWLSDNKKKGGGITMHENLDGIEQNNASPIALIFKMAIATGWDCPRAHILVKLRDNMGETFEIQTFGRIRRMPEAKHYGNDELDSCYLYTLDSKFIEGAKTVLGKGALDASLIYLKDKYKNIELTSEQHPDVEDENDPQKAIRSLMEHFKTSYELSNNTEENRKKMESHGYVFDESIIETAKYGKLRLSSETATLKNADFKVPLNTHIHGREYHHQLGRISSDVSLSYENVNSIIQRLFCARKIRGNRNRKLLSLELRPLYAFVLNNIEKLREDFRLAMTEQILQGSLGINTGSIVKKTFKIPQECLFTYDASEMSQKVFSKNVYKNYLESAEVRSGGEKAFERFCENSEYIQWFYKNGDKGTEYYSILYEDNNGKQRAFYPDYIVGTAGGIWIIETKGGEDKSGNSQNIDSFSAKKFEALKAYTAQMNTEGHNLYSGFVRQEGNGKLCICTENYSEKIMPPNWRLLEDVMK